eukprot:s6407_g5.t1
MALGRPPALGAAFRARQAAESATASRLPLLPDELQGLHEQSKIPESFKVQPKLRRIVHEVRAIAASNRHQASGRFSGRGGNLERGVAEVSGGPIQNYVLVFGPIRVFNRANFAKIAGGKV